jgi:hypothetical protein
LSLGARFALGAFACLFGWSINIGILVCYGGGMVKDLVNSKFGRTVIALGCGALAPAVPALVMGDTHTFRMSLSSALGAIVAAIALHFKSEGGAS